MAKGGKRPGAGRPNGAKSRKTREVAVQSAAQGITPLEYMMQVMRNKRLPASRRDEMAKSAAPYMHPRLAAIEHTGAGGGPIEHALTGARSTLASKLARLSLGAKAD
jgi:hypothetical protein